MSNPAAKETESLLDPFTLGDLPLRNRVVMAPLTRTRADNPGRVPNDLMREYYAQRATAGLIITEGTFVSEDAVGWYGAPGIFTDDQALGWKSVTDAVHARGGSIFCQLWHQGSVSDREFYPDGRLPLAPSAVNPGQLVHVRGGTRMSETPREMTPADIRRTVDEYRHAAEMAKAAGFDGVQIQAGYVYLIQQFLHETTNRRGDAYGGTIERRARFLFEVLDAVLQVWPAARVGVKTGPMMNERGALKATASTLATCEYVYQRLSGYGLSHLFVMRQNADLTGTPIEALAGDAAFHHVHAHYTHDTILNVGITPPDGARLIRERVGSLVAFGRDFIANPDLVERIRRAAPLNVPRPEYFYGSSAEGYTDYPVLNEKDELK